MPGGGVDPGEDARQCAQREVMEELGLDVEVGRSLAVDWSPASPVRAAPMGVHFIFDAGVIPRARSRRRSCRRPRSSTTGRSSRRTGRSRSRPGAPPVPGALSRCRARRGRGGPRLPFPAVTCRSRREVPGRAADGARRPRRLAGGNAPRPRCPSAADRPACRDRPRRPPNRNPSETSHFFSL
ncbi:NUDIX domain-containing protein [Brachybacterium sp. GPGPB12]|uniref:NUDIX domain-containing protein n=1 Tax=Brachybacterium sp. GPGPB12 TaxID=3023517 RepID=UPI00313437C1